MIKCAGSGPRAHASGPGLFLGALLGLASCLLAPSAVAEQLPTSKLAAPATSLPRHRLEVRALSEPEAVLALLPGLIETSRAKGDHRELALL